MELRRNARRAAAGALLVTLGLMGLSASEGVAQEEGPEVASVDLSAAAGKSTITLRFEGDLANAVISDFTMDDPRAVVVDMVGVGCGDVAPDVAGEGAPVERVRLKQFEDDTGSICTLNAYLSEEATYSLKREGQQLSIELTAGAAAAADPLAAAMGGQPASSGAASGGAASSDAGRLENQELRGEAVGAVSGPTQVAGASLSSLDFENLDGISRVVIGTTKDVDFTSSQPEQGLVVIDLQDLTLPSSLTRVLDTSEFISPVRMVRAYDTRDGVRVAVSLRRSTEWVVNRGPDNLLYVDVQVPAEMQQDRQLAAQGFQTVAPSGGGDSDIKGAYASETLISSTGRTSSPSSAFGEGRGASDPAALLGANGFMFDSSNAGNVSYGGRRINIDLVEADIHSVFRLISHVSRLNIVAGDDVKGSVTVRLEDVPWDQALAAILQSKGLGAQRFGNIVRIAPIETIKAEQQQAVEAMRAREELTPLELLVIPLNYGHAGDLVGQIESLVSSRGSVQVDERSNQLIIQETEERLAQIRELIRHIDRQTPQVLIEARIVEAIASYTKDIGIQWGGQLDASSVTGYGTGLFFPSSVQMSGGLTTTTTGNRNIFFAPGQDNLAVDLGATAPTGTLAFHLGSVPGLVDIDARLSALESDGYGEVISSPRVTTLDNVTATIRQGARLPFLSTSAGGTQVQFVTAALVLEVTPHITSDNKVFMTISVSNNRPDFSQQAQGQPAIQIKEAETQLLVADGDTMVIGGVFATEETETIRRIPLFSKIPLLGYLFRNKQVNRSRNEMLVFVTPSIVTRSQ
ncbi:MAG: type IV pilus secretin PilQ [Alphaproteobacteria bacterium]|nr:type IV pilus secretin PilQ [Alphaproteobacteria bacterium]